MKCFYLFSHNDILSALPFFSPIIPFPSPIALLSLLKEDLSLLKHRFRLMDGFCLVIIIPRHIVVVRSTTSGPASTTTSSPLQSQVFPEWPRQILIEFSLRNLSKYGFHSLDTVIENHRSYDIWHDCFPETLQLWYLQIDICILRLKSLFPLTLTLQRGFIWM